MYNIKWHKLITNLIIWLTAEILLTCLGLDDLADYGEFVEKKSVLVLIG